MKKAFQTFILALAFVSLSVGKVNAQSGSCGDNLTWTFDASSGKLSITGTGAMNNYLYGGAPWYVYAPNITLLSLPEGLTNLGNNAFYNCDGLTSITIDQSVTTIGNSAFYRCDGLISVVIGNSVMTIEDNAFMDCSKLTSVNIGNSVKSIGDSAFSNCNCLTSVEIPNSVESLGNNVFYFCSSLEWVSIGNSVKTIGNNAFHSCSGLTSLVIGNSVMTIGDNAFSDCLGLTSVVIPNSVTAISNNAFSYCTGLVSIDVDANNPNYSSLNGVLFDKTQERLILYPGSKTGGYIIPNTVKIIGDSAFLNCLGLTSVSIPNSVTLIRYDALAFCVNLASVISFASVPPTLARNVFGGINPTKDARPLFFRINNTEAGLIDVVQDNAGKSNLALGHLSLSHVTKNLHLPTTGQSNTAIGVQALRTNTSGSGNIAIGRWATNLIQPDPIIFPSD